MLRHYFSTSLQWLVDFMQKVIAKLSKQRHPLNRQINSERCLTHLARCSPQQLPPFVQESTVALHYLQWLGRLNWQNFPERSDLTPDGQQWRGSDPQATAPYVAAMLIKIDRQLPHLSDLRQFLVDHPALPWVLGFPLVPSTQFRWGFDVEASLPSHHHFTRLMRKLPNDSLQFLLSSSVSLIQNQLPDHLNFGDAVSLDTKHILAWVRENNPKEFIKGGRFHKEKQPKGDPDCRVGFKANGNQRKSKNDELPLPELPTPTTEATPGSHVRPGDYLWGYASGVVATKIPEWGEFVLAEMTQPFDQGELTYFFPLMHSVETRLGKRPRFAALDAAFDAFYVYEHFWSGDPKAPGFAAVPLRFNDMRSFDPNGLPLCAAGLAMPLKSTYLDRSHLIPHQCGRYACPLLFPNKSADACPVAHKNWLSGGCLTTMATSIGARLRYQLDRTSEDYQRIYKQRTATERVNSQAVELGIEHPKLRNQRSIANQNTLIYIVINLRALDRIALHKPA